MANSSITDYQLCRNDTDASDITPYLNDAVDFIQEGRSLGHSVLVHCQQGVSRSASLVIAYLIKYENMPLAKAYAALRKERKQVKPKSNFLSQLIRWEKSLKENPYHVESKVSTPLSPITPKNPTIGSNNSIVDSNTKSDSNRNTKGDSGTKNDDPANGATKNNDGAKESDIRTQSDGPAPGAKSKVRPLSPSLPSQSTDKRRKAYTGPSPRPLSSTIQSTDTPVLQDEKFPELPEMKQATAQPTSVSPVRTVAPRRKPVSGPECPELPPSVQPSVPS